MADEPSHDALLQKGTSLYKQFCSHCHGLGMVNPGTSSYDLRKWPKDRKDDFVSVIVGGKGSMPAWGDILEEDEIEALWAYVASRGGKDPLPVQQPADAAPPDALPAAPKANLIEPGKLTACLASNGGALSGRRIGGGSGLDYRIAEALAKRLELTLDIVWFESEPDEESDPVRETYAMLAMRLCDIAPGYALYETAVGDPFTKRAAPPRWDSQPDSWKRGTQIDLEPVAVSAPYMRAELGVVLGPKAAGRPIASFADLAGLTVGIQQGTLSGAILEVQGPAAVKAAALTLPPGPKFLWEMEIGRFDATLCDVAAYDFHRKQNPVTKLTLSSYRHPLGFNTGVAMLEANAVLRAAINTAIDAILADGSVAKMAAAEKVTYAPPQKPWIAPRLTLASLQTR